jgi:hypothetical protein
LIPKTSQAEPNKVEAMADPHISSRAGRQLFRRKVAGRLMSDWPSSLVCRLCRRAWSWSEPPVLLDPGPM